VMMDARWTIESWSWTCATHGRLGTSCALLRNLAVYVCGPVHGCSKSDPTPCRLYCYVARQMLEPRYRIRLRRVLRQLRGYLSATTRVVTPGSVVPICVVSLLSTRHLGTYPSKCSAALLTEPQLAANRSSYYSSHYQVDMLPLMISITAFAESSDRGERLKAPREAPRWPSVANTYISQSAR
jgi:hypothetical protein